MAKTSYSMEIAAAINNYLEENHWNFDFDEKKGVFYFNLSIRSKIKSIRYIISVDDDNYSAFAVCPIGADQDDPEMMERMAEFICRANFGLKFGNFEFDFRDGEIRYKANVLCNDIIPNEDIIRYSIFCPSRMFERYGNGIVDIIFGGASAKDAVEKCEKDNTSDIRRLLESLMERDSSSDGDSDTEIDAEQRLERLETLAGMLGIDVDSDDSEDVKDVDEDGE